MSINSEKKYLTPWVLAVHTMNIWRFGTDASVTLLVFSATVEEYDGQPVAMCICGLFASALATPTLLSLKKVNVQFTASWTVVPENHMSEMVILDRKKEPISNLSS